MMFRTLLCLTFVSMGAVAQSFVLPVSAYDFAGNLNPTYAANTHVGAAEFRTGGGPSTLGTASYQNATVGAVNKQVVDVPVNSFIRALHGISSNGGGSYVNQYTILMDIRFSRTAEPWTSLYNTNFDNANDGDAWVQWGVGIGVSGQYAGTVPNNEWFRLVFSADLPGNSMKFYVNGTLVNSATLSDGVDGTRSLYSWNDGDTDSDAVDMLADNDGESVPKQLSQLAFWDSMLSDADVAALGPVGSAVPEPASIIAVSLGVLALLRRKR